MDKPLSPENIVRSGLCIGCGSCVAMEGPPEASMQFDRYGQLKPGGAASWFNKPSAQFARTCPFSPRAVNEDQLAEWLYPGSPYYDKSSGHFEAAYVGHVAEADFREQGSSGGMVTWVAAELFRKGLIDGLAHVVATNPSEEGRFFRYRIARTEAEIREGARSRYYPIELSEILSTIRAVPGRYAIVGIPCFIKAVQLLRREDPVLRERIRFTLGLFCGHMKSARFVHSMAWQMKVPMADVKAVEFRFKDSSRPANWYNAMLTLKDGTVVNKDWWNLGDGDWGAGFFMNNACNFCDDVVGETADISFGDAWVEPYSSDGRGTNVVVVRSPLINQIIDDSIEDKRLCLKPVDGSFVSQTQAAGLRQRREGLAYRLSWKKTGVKPVKRVAADSTSLTKERKLIYRMRYWISAWSHRVFSLAHKFSKPQIYVGWARLVGALYYGIAYHHGRFSEISKRYREWKKQ